MPSTANINLPELIARFGCEDKCREYLEELRWPDGVVCIRCGATKGISRIAKRNTYACESCGYQFSVKAGTVMHDSKLPLWKWFLTVFLMIQAKKGVSAKQLQRTIGGSYKTAWYLCHRVRAAMGSLVDRPLSGIVEVDESYVGGKVRGKGRGYRGNKTMVLGAVERGGVIRLKVEKRNDRETLHRFIKRHVAGNAKAIHTDEWEAYKGIADADTRHETVNHHAEEWVRGDVHTNTVENVWSLLKRSIVGSYHRLSAKHLPAYLDELEWRFNNRDNPYLFRDTILALMDSETLGYAALVTQRGNSAS